MTILKMIMITIVFAFIFEMVCGSSSADDKNWHGNVYMSDPDE